MSRSEALRWGAVEAATRAVLPRVPFTLNGVAVGSVAAAHLGALQGLSDALQVRGDGVALQLDAAGRDAELARLNATLRDQGLVRAWRNELYPIPDPAGGPPLAAIERASSRFWGTATLGAHCTGWVAGDDGRPAALWIAQRSFDKATDPGAFDNLVGGGVPMGQSPWDTLLREGWEEAGLPEDVMRRARPGRVLQLRRDIPEGLQLEWIHSHDLCLRPGERPVNQDGEVHAFSLLPVAEALALAAGDTMTVDAALVTLDFALRHALLAPAEAAELADRAAGLWQAQA